MGSPSSMPVTGINPSTPNISRYRAISTNRLVNSKHYGTILKEYNRQFAENNGKVNSRQFLKDFIAPLIPDYPEASWYKFLKRFKSAAGIEAARQVGKIYTLPKLPTGNALEETRNLEVALLENARATTEGIQSALNIGAETLREIFNGERISLMSDKDKIDLLFKAMRAQDSRINAIARIKQDSREEKKFQKAFDDAAFGEQPDE